MILVRVTELNSIKFILLRSTLDILDPDDRGDLLVNFLHHLILRLNRRRSLCAFDTMGFPHRQIRDLFLQPIHSSLLSRVYTFSVASAINSNKESPDFSRNSLLLLYTDSWILPAFMEVTLRACAQELSSNCLMSDKWWPVIANFTIPHGHGYKTSSCGTN